MQPRIFMEYVLYMSYWSGSEWEERIISMRISTIMCVLSRVVDRELMKEKIEALQISHFCI